jgi:signal transduction histidine kinase/DNA-binding response OmpR family regulator
MKTVKKSVLFLSFALFLTGFCISLPGCIHEASAADTAQVTLTEAEKEFIQAHPVIRLGVDPTFVPYEFIDSDGIYKGIAADYIALICQKTGLKMEAAGGLTWSEAYEKGVKKELDVLPCISKTELRTQYFLFSDTYFTFQRAIYIQKNQNQIKSFDDLSGQTVAVQANSSHHGFLSQYRSIKLSLYPTVEEALTAVSDGTESSFVGNLATSNYLTKSLGITNLKYITVNLGENQSLHFAVRNDWPELVGIINKALAGVTKEEKISISNKWLGVQESPDYSEILKIIGIGGAVIALIIIVSIFWILRLRKEVAMRKKAQGELQAAKEDAERANQTKSMFLARMSHEIRTPLHAIMGISYLFKKTDMTLTQGIYLDKMLQAAKNMLGLINDILDFSKIEAGKIEIESVSFDLDKVLQRVISIESVKIEEQGIELALDKEPSIPQQFFGDPARIEQILLNIVSNAIKFTKKGFVLLSVRIHTKIDERYMMEFSVIDSGIGMSQEQIDKLFVPFDQGDSSISRRFGGTGLGMSIVKNLVELMGGEIDVSSAINKGSAFTIRLPLTSDTGNNNSDIQNMAADCFRNIRALLFEKNESSRSLLENCLNSFGISFDWAASEYDVILMARNAAEADGRPYNLFIVDFLTPDENGIAYISRLKSMVSPGQQAKYILMLPLSREDLFEEAEAAGIDFGILKPIIPSVLYNGIIELFGIKPPQKKEPPDTPDAPASIYPYHILLVEDNKTNQFIAQSILEQAGFKVSKADGGNEGYEFFKTHHSKLDLILMDIHMPDMDGYTASDLIREIDPDVPIVAMTADAIAGVENTCKSHGMDHYVSKPFEPDELIATILTVLKSKKRDRPLDPKTDTPADENVLDSEDGIRRLGGDSAIYGLILQEYLSENAAVSETLDDKINQKDYEGAVQIVHKIKSSSGNIGAKSLYAAASELQASLKAGDQDEIPLKHSIFTNLFLRTLAEIRIYIEL